MHLPPVILMLFMLSLAVVPLAMVWQDRRRRALNARRIHALREEAQVSARLRGIGMGTSGTMPWGSR